VAAAEAAALSAASATIMLADDTGALQLFGDADAPVGGDALAPARSHSALASGAAGPGGAHGTGMGFRPLYEIPGLTCAPKVLIVPIRVLMIAIRVLIVPIRVLIVTIRVLMIAIRVLIVPIMVLMVAIRVLIVPIRVLMIAIRVLIIARTVPIVTIRVLMIATKPLIHSRHGTDTTADGPSLGAGT
jgi:hypothetical protein